MTRDEIIKEVISAEGGYVDDPSDSGGKTRWGITERVARETGYRGEMSKLPIEHAMYIYLKDYWLPIRGDELLRIDSGVAHEVFDTAVNCGPATASLFLQVALNALNDRGRLYDDRAEDGIIGPKTIGALLTYCTKRDPQILLKALNCLQGDRYIRLTRSREKDERFLYGWLKNRVRL